MDPFLGLSIILLIVVIRRNIFGRCLALRLWWKCFAGEGATVTSYKFSGLEPWTLYIMERVLSRVWRRGTSHDTCWAIAVCPLEGWMFFCIEAWNDICISSCSCTVFVLTELVEMRQKHRICVLNDPYGSCIAGVSTCDLLLFVYCIGTRRCQWPRVYGWSRVRVAGSNPAGGIDVCVVCVVQ